MAAAVANEFYVNLLRRGTSDFDAGRYEQAISSLRVAAFGLVDTIDQYELAYVYLTLAYDRLGHRDEAHDAAHHIVTADRIAPQFASLALPSNVRSAFNEIVTRYLSAADVAALNSSAQPPRSQASAPSQPSRQAAVPPSRAAVSEPKETPKKAETSAPAPAPQPAKAPAAKNEPKKQPEKPQLPATTDAVKPQPAAAATDTAKPQPPQSTPTVTPPAASKPSATATQPASPKPATTAPQQSPRMAGTSTTNVDVPARLAAANRALDDAQLAEARRVLRELLEVRALSHETTLRIAEGLYRARDFAGALLAFERVGPLRKGEEPYRYYAAVALYETGNYAAAKRELEAALPYIELTPDVARYRLKIQASVP